MGAESNTSGLASRIAAAAVWFLASSLGVACGDDAQGPTGAHSDAGPRPLPTRQAPGPRQLSDAGIDAGIPDDYVSSYDAGECCAIRFAFGAEQGEVYAILRGTDAPLDSLQGIPMTYEMGVWTASVCMPPNYTGVYYYEVFSVPDAGQDASVDAEPIEVAGDFDPTGLFRSTRHNDAALTERDPVLGVVNLFPATDACGGTDAGLHGALGADDPTGDMDAGL